MQELRFLKYYHEINMLVSRQRSGLVPHPVPIFLVRKTEFLMIPSLCKPVATKAALPVRVKKGTKVYRKTRAQRQACIKIVCGVPLLIAARRAGKDFRAAVQGSLVLYFDDTSVAALSDALLWSAILLLFF